MTVYLEEVKISEDGKELARHKDVSDDYSNRAALVYEADSGQLSVNLPEVLSPFYDFQLLFKSQIFPSWKISEMLFISPPPLFFIIF